MKEFDEKGIQVVVVERAEEKGQEQKESEKADERWLLARSSALQ